MPRTYFVIVDAKNEKYSVAFRDGEDEPYTVYLDSDIPPMPSPNAARRVVSALNEQSFKYT